MHFCVECEECEVMDCIKIQTKCGSARFVSILDLHKTRKRWGCINTHYTHEEPARGSYLNENIDREVAKCCAKSKWEEYSIYILIFEKEEVIDARAKREFDW